VFRLLLISDRRQLPDPAGALEAAAGACAPGELAFLFRERDLAPRALLDLAAPLRATCRRLEIPFLVSARCDLARALEADGVHLPAQGLPIAAARRHLGPRALIGRSTHSPAEAAAAAGADYLTFGPLWATPSKAGLGEPLGLEALAALDAPAPALGLGGVTPARAPALAAAGAWGLACIRGVLGAPDPAAAAQIALAPWRL